MWQAMCLVCIKRAQSNLGGLWPSSCTHSPVSCGPGHHQPSWVSPKPQLKVLHSLSAQTSSWGREVAEGHPRQGTSSWRFELTQRHLRRKAHKHDILYISCWCSVSKMCLTLCNPMDCSTPGFPVLPHLSEFTQTLVHWVGDAIKPSHPLSPPSPLLPKVSASISLFQWVSSLHQVAKVLELQLQSFQWICRTDLL